jgi:hypothetical protein
MSKLVEKERRRDAVRLHLENDHLIAIGHVVARAAVLDMMIESAVETLSKSYPSTLRKKALELSIPQKLELFKEVLNKRSSQARKRDQRIYKRSSFGTGASTQDNPWDMASN